MTTGRQAHKLVTSIKLGLDLPISAYKESHGPPQIANTSQNDIISKSMVESFSPPEQIAYN